MKCFTVSHFDELGNSFYKEKQKFMTLDSAIETAKLINSKEDSKFKLVAYKCPKCHQYHIGKNGNVLKEKEKEKFSKFLKW